MIEIGTISKELGVPPKLLIENELDWEHLPHLHSSVFRDIRLLKTIRAGWSAVVTFADDSEATLEVILDDDRLGWSQTTSIGGETVGRTITRLTPLKPELTRISITFTVPNLAGQDIVALADFYQNLYSGLLEEDERKVLARAAALKAGPKGRRLLRCVTLDDGTEHEIPVTCPHRGLPLNTTPNENGIITCPWHGYAFDVRTGHCVSGQIGGWRR